VTLEASWFRGEEPDEDRIALDRPRLNSWSARAGWRRGPWYAQFSGGRLHRPEAFEPFDITRLTASIEYNGAVGGRPVAATLLWGENREVHGVLDGYLFEWDVRATAQGFIYGRAESTAKDILDLGPDTPTFIDVHRVSHVAALTIGYLQDVTERPWGRIGIGADAGFYHIDSTLAEFYGSPHSFHVFVRYRPSRSSAHTH
jgi:hypothetical protein